MSIFFSCFVFCVQAPVNESSLSKTPAFWLFPIALPCHLCSRLPTIVDCPLPPMSHTLMVADLTSVDMVTWRLCCTAVHCCLLCCLLHCCLLCHGMLPIASLLLPCVLSLQSHCHLSCCATVLSLLQCVVLLQLCCCMSCHGHTAICCVVIAAACCVAIMLPHEQST